MTRTTCPTCGQPRCECIEEAICSLEKENADLKLVIRALLIAAEAAWKNRNEERLWWHASLMARCVLGEEEKHG